MAAPFEARRFGKALLGGNLCGWIGGWTKYQSVRAMSLVRPTGGAGCVEYVFERVEPR
jgi:hypothetical protein